MKNDARLRRPAVGVRQPSAELHRDLVLALSDETLTLRTYQDVGDCFHGGVSGRRSARARELSVDIPSNLAGSTLELRARELGAGQGVTPWVRVTFH
jgi:hypothetical protein